MTKSIQGGRFYGNFDSLDKAVLWKNTYHPITNPNPLDSVQQCELTPTAEPNGRDDGRIFRDVWILYQEQHLASLSLSSQQTLMGKATFYDGMLDVRMVDLNPEFFDTYIKGQKELAATVSLSRNSFDQELKMLKTLLFWYRDNYDFTFKQPLLPRHKIIGRIRPQKTKNKKMSAEQISSFFDAFELPEERMWLDFAKTQFFIGGRVQEPAGLTIRSVNLEERSLEIRTVAVWSRTTKRFVELKELPKNGEVRYCHITDSLYEILERRLRLVAKGCPYLFHIDGKPLDYRKIQYRYNKALKKCGLNPEFSATHIMRHSMATITRKVTGSKDATQAVTGHRDQRMVEHYASIPEEMQKNAVNQVDNYLRSISKTATDALEVSDASTLTLVKS